MLDHAVRYFPILRLLEGHVCGRPRILEVGSGPYGVGEFYPYPFVGTDVCFFESPRKPMLPVLASGSELPFADASFDAVVASDVLEHIPPGHRPHVVREAMRVARRVVLIGFPCGRCSHALDRRLYSDYQRLHMVPPAWLEEHAQYPFPDESLFESIGYGWSVRSVGNDNLQFHYWLLRAMMYSPCRLGFQIVEKCMLGILRKALQLADREPFYRRIFVLARNSDPVAPGACLG